MKQETNIIKIVKIDDKAPSVGKCSMCNRQIVNDPEEFWCAESRMIGNKFYCGGCLLELAPIIDEVKESFGERKIVSEAEGHFYTIDQATGRMVVADAPKEREIKYEQTSI